MMINKKEGVLKKSITDFLKHPLFLFPQYKKYARGIEPGAQMVE